MLVSAKKKKKSEVVQEGGVVVRYISYYSHLYNDETKWKYLKEPLTAYYDQAALNWLRSHPGQVITAMFQISEIFRTSLYYIY